MDIPAVRDFKVSNIQDASVTVVDYYEPSKCQYLIIQKFKIMFLLAGIGEILVKKKLH